MRIPFGGAVHIGRLGRSIPLRCGTGVVSKYNRISFSGERTFAHPSVRGCDRSPDGTSTNPEADPPVVDVSDHGVTIIRPHRRSKR